MAKENLHYNIDLELINDSYFISDFPFDKLPIYQLKLLESFFMTKCYSEFIKRDYIHYHDGVPYV